MVWLEAAQSGSLPSLWQDCRLHGRANDDLLQGDTTPPRAAANAPTPGQAIGFGLGKHALNQVEQELLRISTPKY